MKRIISLMLALLMLASAATMLFSCDKKEENNNKETEKGTVVDDGSIFYERSLVSDDLPDANYGGRSFRIVTHMRGEVEIPEEERNQGDLIKDTKFTRNQAVENRFNIEIEVVYTGNYVEIADYASKTILAGSDEFDLLMGQVLQTANTVTKNLYLNWYEIENVNFDKPWWFKSTSEDLSYDDKCILAISNLSHSAVSGVLCMFFNKALATSYEMGDLYKLVLDGKWTFDKLMELVKDVYVDNGDDVRDENDFYGYAQSSGTTINAYLWAFDNPICTKNAEGKPEITLKSDKIDSIINDIYDMCYNTKGVWCDTYASGGQSKATNLFFD